MDTHDCKDLEFVILSQNVKSMQDQINELNNTCQDGHLFQVIKKRKIENSTCVSATMKCRECHFTEVENLHSADEKSEFITINEKYCEEKVSYSCCSQFRNSKFVVHRFNIKGDDKHCRCPCGQNGPEHKFKEAKTLTGKSVCHCEGCHHLKKHSYSGSTDSSCGVCVDCQDE